jgi:mRNA-degrading endonuclease RelE of RelBE toxin-antitoxin system
MAKRIAWTEQAKADLRAIERLTALHVLKTLARYAKNGEGSTKRLQGIDPPLIRLRAQDYRVFFRDKGE